jgi:hypothetical protein
LQWTWSFVEEGRNSFKCTQSNTHQNSAVSQSRYGIPCACHVSLFLLTYRGRQFGIHMLRSGLRTCCKYTTCLPFLPLAVNDLYWTY